MRYDWVMQPHYRDDAVTLYHGDCLDVLRALPDSSVDSVVTDPPYGLEFMGKEWDKFAPQNTTAQRSNAGGFGEEEGKPWNKARSGTRGVRSTFRCRACQGWSGAFSEARAKRQKACECEAPDYDYAGAPAQTVAFGKWCELWTAECLRVLKPGGHLLAFGGSRTWHRLAVAVEDAGFEVRDSIAWLYGQGFPKSLNVGKDARFCQCEKTGNLNGPSEPATEHGVRDVRDADVSQAEGTGRGPRSVLLTAMSESGSPAAGRAELSATSVRAGEPSMEGRRDAQEAEGELHGGAVRALPAGVPGDGSSGRLHHGAPASDGSVARSLPAAVRSGEPQGPRPVEQRAGELGAVPVERGSQAGRGGPVCAGCGKPSAPAGLGTALKPSFEPIVVARKPLIGTVAANVLAHGTGALNIDGCRVEGEPWKAHRATGLGSTKFFTEGEAAVIDKEPHAAGRWPANVVLDESQAAALDQQSGVLTSGANPTRRGSDKFGTAYGDFKGRQETPARGADSGGASRFFYVAKAPTRERPKVDGVAHPTVKPLALMRWLVRLVTPPGGTVLEPFAGSGTTVEACALEGFACIAIEREPDYLPLIQARLARVEAAQPEPAGPSLFDMEETA